jgi:hypothetical protein
VCGGWDEGEPFQRFPGWPAIPDRDSGGTPSQASISEALQLLVQRYGLTLREKKNR